MIRLRKSYAGLLLLTSRAANSQSFSLKQAVDYAITNQVQVKNSQIDLQNAGAKINEIKAMYPLKYILLLVVIAVNIYN
jgi:hypothetical protein